MQTRRHFCSDMCKAALLGSAMGSLPGCGGGGSSTGPNGSSSNASSLARLSASVASNVATLNIDASSALASTGGLALVQAGSAQLLVARTGASTFSALTATCTHEACTIDGSSSGRFVCPCHGSTFDTSGRVITGPAVTSLRSFNTAFVGSTLTITL